MGDDAPPSAAEARPGDITGWLHAWRAGDAEAMERLMPLVYDALHALAERHMRRERDGHTLTPTALVHEAWLRLVDQRRADLRDRTHFLSLASRVMRRVLVDHARRAMAGKRSPVAPTLDLATASPEEWSVTMMAIDDALVRLADVDPRLVRVLELRFFGGLTEEETAEVLGVSGRTVHRDWLRARAWLEIALRD
jgi:RNA polymerase sigma-70 factor, ECF subfamily